MSTGRRYRARITALLAAALASCAHEEKKAPAAEQAAAAPPQPTQQTVPQQPRSRQEEVTDAQTRLEAAHQDVARAQEQLALAQQREEQERANVQQLEIQARQDLDRASQLAFQAEQAQGLQAASGRITQATPSRILLQLHDGRTMSFQVDDRTRVLVGSEERGVSEIQQGADARVAFDPKSDERRALTIRLAPMGRELGVTPPTPRPETEQAPPR